MCVGRENRNMQEYLRLVSEEVEADIFSNRNMIQIKAQAYAPSTAANDKPLGVLLRYLVKDESIQAQKQTTKVALQSRRAGDKIRIAVIGTGSFAKNTHLPNLQRLSDSITPGHNEQNGQQYQSRRRAVYGADYASTNYQDVLDDPDVDAVLICRHHLRATSHASCPSRQGCLCRKPMAVNQGELDQLSACLQKAWLLYGGLQSALFRAALRAKRKSSARLQNPLMVFYRMNAGSAARPLD